VDRRRIALVEPGMPAAPIHHDGKPLDDDAVTSLVANVRASATRATSAALDELTAALPDRIEFYGFLTANFRTEEELPLHRYFSEDSMILERSMTGTVIGEILGIPGNGRPRHLPRHPRLRLPRRPRRPGAGVDRQCRHRRPADADYPENLRISSRA
jgi:hypothetical protein